MTTKFYWIFWILFCAALSLFLFNMLTGKTSQQALMPGPLSDGHHQFADNCQVCHTDAFGEGEVLQEACMDCHGELRQKPMDSHPAAKFKDPRNADLLQQINALECVSCHVEHKQEITQKDGITQPLDFCVHCHQDVEQERPSHEGMDFMTCKDSGCHNYHNNRALYTDFLVKHLEDPAIKDRAILKEREFGKILDELMKYPHQQFPVTALAIEDADMHNKGDPELVEQWHQSRHAAAGVNCSACHQPLDENKEPQAWRDTPDEKVCAVCHDLETKGFQQGKHGMRLDAALPPLQVKEARLPMKTEAGHQSLTCNSCHSDHAYDVQVAAVDACLNCHNDKHSLAYQNSPHYRLWQEELKGTKPEGSGISCASCHMPRINVDVNDWVSRIMVDHNQSRNLSPNSKMLRSSCLHCHGLNFSLNALADPQQIENNFSTPPAKTLHPSMELARRDNERYLRETANLPTD